MSKTCPVCGTVMIGKECAFCGYSEEKKTKVKEVESNKPEYEHDFANSVPNIKIKVRKDSSSQSTFVTAICIAALLIIVSIAASVVALIKFFDKFVDSQVFEENNTYITEHIDESMSTETTEELGYPVDRDKTFTTELK